MGKTEKKELTYDIENSYGDLTICGVDEAGRGPLCGPVCAAAVILPRGLIIEGLNDSKKLSEKRREELFDEITEVAIDYSVAYASVEEIDSINILNATMLAMRRAINGLKKLPDLALIDGNAARNMPTKAVTVVKGDSKSPSIAAASILAKVSRDRLCAELDKKYPEYGIAKHKGYCTKLHMEMLEKYGPTECHRKTFLGFLERGEEKDD